MDVCGPRGFPYREGKAHRRDANCPSIEVRLPPDAKRTINVGDNCTLNELESFASTRPEELTAFVGKHMIYTYDNGWQYEIYIKNATTVDYRIHSGLVGGRWVRNQMAHIVRLAEQTYKVSWDEPTGTAVSLTFMLATRTTHGAVFFPNWIVNDPGKTVCFQNDRLDEMRACRDAGPTYPKLVLDEFSTITFVEDCGAENEAVIACAPSELPVGYAGRRNY